MNSVVLLVLGLLLCGFWLQRSILWDTLLLRWLGVSGHIQEVLQQSRQWNYMQ